MYPGWQGNYMTYGGFQTGPVGSFQEPVPKPPLRVKLAPRERGSYNIFLSQADPDGHNRVEGPTAVEFFKRSGLPTDVLKSIWTICTPEGESFLDRERFYVALRLIAYAQEGKPVTEQSIFDDIAAGIPKFQSAVVIKDKWDIENADRDKYVKAFNSICGGKGFLTTEEAVDVFRKTQVKGEYLKKIWNLSDPEDSGEFRESQFIVAMHLITRVKNLSEPVPDELPLPLKKVISAKPLEPQKTSQPEPFGNLGMPGPQKNQNDAFADFGLSAISQPKPPEISLGSGFGMPQGSLDNFAFSTAPAPKPGAFQTAQIKINLEEPRSSISSQGSMNSMNSMKIKTEEKPQKVEELKEVEPIPEPLIIKRNSITNQHIERNDPAIEVKSKKTYSDMNAKDDELSEQLERVEEKIQKKLREWRDIRSKLSLEREKTQILSLKLHEAGGKYLNDLAKLMVNILEE
ncbi:hypothetical protein SteCoe_29278 [Stentor coeruleus]|uniref:EH domain-containing protein n=1 Tax=Stentor coeruleus TaxID=5963 RepID=A0A1R2B6C2_9CILI|nr:hypothetical protein SteCoe_29278 [Stentor coeruleus]